MARVVATYTDNETSSIPKTWDFPAKRSNAASSRDRELEPVRIGGEVDGEPAVGAFSAQRLGNLAADCVGGGDTVDRPSGIHRDMDLDELRAPDFGDVTRER